ncbi:Uncharacterised protein [Chlamydia abortus]|nr:Uncharacterised protein [Chlamydia abortus]
MEHALLLNAFTKEEMNKVISLSKDRVLHNEHIPFSPSEKATILDNV